MIAYAEGDARRLLNTLETLAVAATQEKRADITDVWLLKVLGERMRSYDKTHGLESGQMTPLSAILYALILFAFSVSGIQN